MEKEKVLAILAGYGINDYSEAQEIDSTCGDDYRLNIVIDKKYVLRINGDVMTEERLASIDRLAGRYREIGVLAPRLFKNKDGRYITPFDKYLCYVSEYLDYPTCRELEDELDFDEIYKDVWTSIGRFSKRYTNTDLTDVNSMWTIIDLAPLDKDIDEKQNNLNTLVSELEKYGEHELAQEIICFNDEARSRIKKVYKDLPRCVIQGDLNPSNLMVKDHHFIGIIDFNMSGTEVNVNHFCCETNFIIEHDEFEHEEPDKLFERCMEEEKKALSIILSEYELNDLEKSVIDDYRRICRISMYPNVMNYLSFLEEDKEKAVKLLKLIIHDGDDIAFIKPSAQYAKEISDYRQEFLDIGDHMDGCGPLRKYENPQEYIEVCRQKSNPDTAEAAGGQAEQFLLVRKSDNRLVGMAQYRFGVDPKFCIGYSVRPSERRKGYAKMALQNLLQWLKDQGQVSTPISCEPSNEASKKVILSCGGKLTDKCTYKGIDLMVFEIPIE
jgi:predicted acetyltransferase/tRNA A-37 threonylcarbamoyl transferase component Bud32